MNGLQRMLFCLQMGWRVLQMKPWEASQMYCYFNRLNFWLINHVPHSFGWERALTIRTIGHAGEIISMWLNLEGWLAKPMG